MAGFRLKSLERVRRIQEDQAASRPAGVHVLAAVGIAHSTATRRLDEIQSAQAVAAGEVRAAEQALLVAVQARRSAELPKDRCEPKQRSLAVPASRVTMVPPNVPVVRDASRALGS